MYCIVYGLNGAGIEILWRFQFYNLRLMFPWPGVFKTHINASLLFLVLISHFRLIDAAWYDLHYSVHASCFTKLSIFPASTMRIMH